MRGLLALVLMLPLAAWAAQPPDSFVQGPEKIGTSQRLAGTVIGVHPGLENRCYVLLADRPGVVAAEGLGGNGRFFLCGKTLDLSMGQAWKGTAQQTSTRLARMGPRWRVLPLFEAR